MSAQASYKQTIPLPASPMCSAVKTGAAAVIIFPAISNLSHSVSSVAWSYSSTPTAGNLQIKNGSDIVFSMDITAAGPGQIPAPFPIAADPGAALTITLASGGGGVTGSVFCQHQMGLTPQ